MKLKSNTARKIEKDAQTNRLVGWLVSYALDTSGCAFEIRTGRTFVSTSQLGYNITIILNENTLSNPHMLINASAKQKVLIQDLFSERGTFIKKEGNQEEVKVSAPVELRHGDWLRIGDELRFQVCLISGTTK